MHPKDIAINDFTYQLPEERIARYPLPERDSSKLLVYQGGKIKTEDTYHNIDQYLPANSLLLFNNTKVVEARLLFKKATGASIEIFCLEPHASYTDITTAMLQTEKVTWMCLIGGVSKWKTGQLLEKTIPYGSINIVLKAKYLEKINDSFAIELSWTPVSLTFAEMLHFAGIIPLPPYIKRSAELSDNTRYQTIYAHTEGSVAAPTAGLHFTESLFEKLDAKNILRNFVTLHVGAGTFQPVKSETMEGHPMHAEFIDVSVELIQQIKDYAGEHITVVGTTSLRTVESLYWLGVKTILFPSLRPEELVIHQWDAYELDAANISADEALTSLLNYIEQQEWDRLITKTQLLITPGYTIRIPKALVTNFHQPQSTLLLLVAAFAGDNWKSIYQYALEHEFRFLSYGDGCLLFR
jgi:S-adenosylmethionine:tRNA ribosyltransferase-isomerase